MQGSNSWASLSPSREVTVVEIKNPVTQNKGAGRKYTDFEICLKSNSKAFTIAQSSVRRRYSDFVWLRNWLSENNEGFSSIRKTPLLPPKKLIGRFEEEFVQDRMRGLQRFLRKVIEQNVFLSDKALHLFLQSNLSVKQIENYLTGRPVGENDCATSKRIMYDNGSISQEEDDPTALSHLSPECIPSLSRITEDSEHCSSLDSDTVICFGSKGTSPNAQLVQNSSRQSSDGHDETFIYESFSSIEKSCSQNITKSTGSSLSTSSLEKSIKNLKWASSCGDKKAEEQMGYSFSSDYVYEKQVEDNAIACMAMDSEDVEDENSSLCFGGSTPIECPPKFSPSIGPLTVGSSPEISYRGLIAAVPIFQSSSPQLDQIN